MQFGNKVLSQLSKLHESKGRVFGKLTSVCFSKLGKKICYYLFRNIYMQNMQRQLTVTCLHENTCEINNLLTHTRSQMIQKLKQTFDCHKSKRLFWRLSLIFLALYYQKYYQFMGIKWFVLRRDKSHKKATMHVYSCDWKIWNLDSIVDTKNTNVWRFRENRLSWISLMHQQFSKPMLQQMPFLLLCQHHIARCTWR